MTGSRLDDPAAAASAAAEELELQNRKVSAWTY